MIPNSHVVVLFNVIWPWSSLNKSLWSLVNKIVDGKDKISEFFVDSWVQFKQSGLGNGRNEHVAGFLPRKRK